MGYACPVCETPQRDGEHLANHLAFTAMLHHDDHETWLDEYVDEWGGMGQSALAALVVSHADEIDFETVFEDAADGHDNGHTHGGTQVTYDSDTLDAEAQSVLREAAELTREMRDDARNDDEADRSGQADDQPDEKA